MPRIFICYRREETSGHAGRLYDLLGTRYGDDVFMDIDAIGPGVDYAKLIDETISSIEVVLVIIGQHWLDIQDSDGRRRLEAPDDLVHQEVAEALARDVLVIPVLVQNATLPEADELPPDLVSLTRRNAIELSDERWRYDAERLVDALDAALSGERPEGTTEEDTEPDALSSVHQDDVDGTPAAQRRSLNGPGSAQPNAGRVLAITGGALVLVFGLLVLPGWHDEQNGIRVAVAVIVVAMAGFGLIARRWNWVMYAGVAGLIGFAVWLVTLLPGHLQNDEIGELVSFDYDGLTNLMVFAGSAILLAGGWLVRSTGEETSQPLRD
jgi:hypothetical protein